MAALLALCCALAGTTPAADEGDGDIAWLFANLPSAIRQGHAMSIPLPADAHVETSFYATVSMPFWQRHLAAASVPPEGQDAATAAAIREIQTSLAQSLATGREELVPTAHYLAADRLWKAGCRDASVALLRYEVATDQAGPLPGEDFHRETLAAATEAEAPLVRFLLAGKWYHTAFHHLSFGRPGVSVDDMNRANAEHVAAFADVARLFREADPRIAETLDVILPLPATAPSLLDNAYLAHCRRADWAMDHAFRLRGNSWASDVTEEGWEGWRKYNEDAETNLLAAIALRPDGTRARMMLASLRGCTCGPKSEVADLFSKAVSNSLDIATPFVGGVLQFETTRWGGSFQSLVDVASNAAATVRTDSTFAWTTVAAAMQKIATYEMDSPTDETELARRIPKPVAEEIFAMFDKYIEAGDQPLLPPPDLYRCMGISFAIQMRDWRRARAYAEHLGRGYGYPRDAAWLRNASNPSGYPRDLNHFLAITYVHSRKDILAILDADAAGDYEAVLPAARRLIDNKGMTQVARYVAETYEARAKRKLEAKSAGTPDEEEE
ncbi:MAG: hypothetical protein ACOX5G_00860 [Kiritimatiellia bacterium]|jgi:hypothetical protein